MIDRGVKVDIKMLEANVKLQDENKILKYDIIMLNKKLELIEGICKTVKKHYPECVAFASRIQFIIETGEDDSEE